MYASQNSWIDSPTKQRLDQCAVALLSPVLCVLLLVLALLIIVVDRSHPLFYQMRVGKGGVPFKFYKLNTMRHVRAVDISRGTDDERSSSLGRWLRRTTLDEVPQILINVLKGDMTLVGPRPLLKADVYLMKHRLDSWRFESWYRAYCTTRPGWTGWFGVRSRQLVLHSDGYLQARSHYDVAYRKHASLSLDIMIVCAHATLPYLDKKRKKSAHLFQEAIGLYASVMLRDGVHEQ